MFATHFNPGNFLMILLQISLLFMLKSAILRLFQICKYFVCTACKEFAYVKRPVFESPVVTFRLPMNEFLFRGQMHMDCHDKNCLAQVKSKRCHWPRKSSRLLMG